MRYRKTKKCECSHYYFAPMFLVTDVDDILINIF